MKMKLMQRAQPDCDYCLGNPDDETNLGICPICQENDYLDYILSPRYQPISENDLIKSLRLAMIQSKQTNLDQYVPY